MILVHHVLVHRHEWIQHRLNRLATLFSLPLALVWYLPRFLRILRLIPVHGLSRRRAEKECTAGVGGALDQIAKARADTLRKQQSAEWKVQEYILKKLVGIENLVDGRHADQSRMRVSESYSFVRSTLAVGVVTLLV